MWAHQAVPPSAVVLGAPKAAVPWSDCIRNQTPKNNIAGTRSVVIKKPRNASVVMRACG
ncbi:hypothetical protein D3C72_2245660 [compost metagenome]